MLGQSMSIFYSAVLHCCKLLISSLSYIIHGVISNPNTPTGTPRTRLQRPPSSRRRPLHPPRPSRSPRKTRHPRSRVERPIQPHLFHRPSRRSRHPLHLQPIRDLLRRQRCSRGQRPRHGVFGREVGLAGQRVEEKHFHVAGRRCRLALDARGGRVGLPRRRRRTNLESGSTVPLAFHRRGWLRRKGLESVVEQRRGRREEGS
mmetsp:Transcript_7547/g.15073  ORF Transcript_7547/g.15073 Transcript_7547/m.15073 type:complete len:203 (-) Transcript_7547:299-907(-)